MSVKYKLPLKAARVLLGMNQIELAKKMNVAQSYISQVETNRINISLSEKNKIDSFFEGKQIKIIW